MSELLEILSNTLEKEQLKENFAKFENLDNLYKFCVNNGYKGDKAKFEKEYAESVKICAESLKASRVSDTDLDSVAGGVNLNNNFKSGMAVLMTALSLSGTASGIASAANTNSKPLAQRISNWSRSDAKITKGGVVAASLGSAMLGTWVGATVASRIASVIHGLSSDSSDFNNTLRLIGSLTPDENKQIPFDTFKKEQQIYLVDKAYKEIGIAGYSLKKADLTSANVRMDLITKIKGKIQILEKSKDKSSEKRIQILKTLVVALTSGSTPGATTQGPAGGPPPPPVNSQGTAGGPPPPPPMNLQGPAGQQVVTEEDRQNARAWADRAATFAAEAERQIAVARENAARFNNSHNAQAREKAAELVAATETNARSARAQANLATQAAERGDVRAAEAACNKARDFKSKAAQAAQNVSNADLLALQNAQGDWAEEFRQRLQNVHNDGQNPQNNQQ